MELPIEYGKIFQRVNKDVLRIKIEAIRMVQFLGLWQAL